jgi:hypothetical protein
VVEGGALGLVVVDLGGVGGSLGWGIMYVLREQRDRVGYLYTLVFAVRWKPWTFHPGARVLIRTMRLLFIAH